MSQELKILIIEDVPRDAEAIVCALQNESLRFQARRIETGEAFLAELKSFAPDIVLSDFTLPEFDALQALRLLQEHQYDIPFILITGTRSEEVAVECLREGADDYILKASLKRLPSSILNVLKKKEAEREKVRAESALRRNEELFRLITENSRDLISLHDLEGHIIYASPSFKTGLGYAPEELSGTDAFALVHPEDQEVLRNTWRQALEMKEGRTAEYRTRHRNGQWRIFESVGNWIFSEDGQSQRTVVVSRDITRRKQAERTLHELPRLIREAQETERRRVARELHDSVNQILSSVKFRIQSVEEKLQDREESAWRETLKAKALLEKAIEEVRRISRNLRPSELDDLGLSAAVRSLCAEFEERTGIKIKLILSQLPEDFRDDLELNVYRILQEALNNVEKHSQAKQVDLSLGKEGALLCVRIQDNGCGFEVNKGQAKGNKKPTMGLVDMQERTMFAGGAWLLKSTPNQGTEIEIRIPLVSPPI